jgi:hypothetical protein
MSMERCVICGQVHLCPYFLVAAGSDNVYDHAGDVCEGCYQKIQQDRRAWDEDEKDMQRIADEWAAYDRDPPGS